MRTAAQGKPALAIFSVTLFLSAALMFAVEPMIGKMLLPLAGGTPAGWIIALAFFQVMLLLGYLAAHLLSRLPPRKHAATFIGLLIAACLFLPIRLPPAAAVPSPVQIFGLLTAAAAIPFIALSMAAATLQRLFTTTSHHAAEDPYFLYAASNIGSFAGLLLYPFAIEPAFGLTMQSRLWFCGFGLLIAASIFCLAVAGKDRPRQKPEKSSVTGKQRLQWLALAFFPSSLMLGVTTHISTDIFSAPLIWIIPLALYLLTFVIAFSRKQFLRLEWLAKMQPAAVSIATGLLLAYNGELRISWYAIALHLFAFTTVALMCHLRLAASRPRGGALTEFYLMIAAGGALGGLLNAFIAPAVLDRLAEYPVILILSCLMNPLFQGKVPRAGKIATAAALTGTVAYALYNFSKADYIHGPEAGIYTAGMLLSDLVLLVLVVIAAMHARAALFGLLALFLAAQCVIPRDVLLTERDFYGVVKVFDRPQTAGDTKYMIRYLVHGTTTHGMQVTGPEMEKVPTAYFWRNGPAGNVFDIYQPKKIAVIGLGAGTLNCYATPKNEFTFIEIDPAVVKVAGDPKLFTFLSACKSKRPPKLIVGDGRLALNDIDGKFDLIVLDAFSSDNIPVHLLTLEALKVYLGHLNPKGLVLLHITSRYFELARILAVNAHELGLKYLFGRHGAEDKFYAARSKWFVMARQDASLMPLKDFGWMEPAPDKGLRPWTDDYTNLLATISIGGHGAPLK